MRRACEGLGRWGLCALLGLWSQPAAAAARTRPFAPVACLEERTHPPTRPAGLQNHGHLFPCGPRRPLLGQPPAGPSRRTWEMSVGRTDAALDGLALQLGRLGPAFTLAPAYVVHSRGAAHAPARYQLWAHGLGGLPAADSTLSPPSVQLKFRRRGTALAPDGQGRRPAFWQLEVQAQKLMAPMEGLVRAGVALRAPQAALHLGAAALDAELPVLPLRPGPGFTKRLRRSGLILAGRWGRLKMAGWRTLQAGGAQRLQTGVRLWAAGHLWFRRMQRPVLDGRLQLDLALALPRLHLGAEAPGHAWGRLLARQMVGGGQEASVLRAGGLPQDRGPGAPRHLLHEGLLGHEDLARYTNRMLSVEAGLMSWVGRRGRLGIFVSAGQVDRGPEYRGRWLRAGGAMAQVKAPWPTFPVVVTYQAAIRQGTSRGRLLHLVTAGV